MNTANHHNLKFCVRVKEITPCQPVFLYGFAARTHPSTGVLDPLYMKVVLLQADKVLLIVTIDALGSDESFMHDIKESLREKFGLEHDQVLFNFSHTHHSVLLTGLTASLRARAYSIGQKRQMSNISEVDFSEDERYFIFLRDALLEMVADCHTNLIPGTMMLARGTSDFAVSRRHPDGHGGVLWQPYFEAEIDHDLFVLKLLDEEGVIKGILYNYGCHPTSMGDENSLISNDFVGVTSQILEDEFPNSTALFLQGCAAELKPLQTAGTDSFHVCNVEQMREAGRYLANDVLGVLRGGDFAEVSCHFRSCLLNFDLPVQPLSAEHYRDMLNGGDVPEYYEETLRQVIQAIETGNAREHFHYSAQVWQFAEDVHLVALKDEVSTEYGLLLKELFGNGKLLVLGYSNGVLTYIPTRKMIPEGGYEVEHAFMSGLRGPFKPEVEDIIVENVRQALDAVREGRMRNSHATSNRIR